MVMRRRAVALVLSLSLLVMMLCACTADNQGADLPTDGETTLPSGIVDIKDIENSVSSPDESAPVVEAIDGFVPGGGIASHTLPYEVPDSGLEVVSLGRYTGRFVEDGFDEEVADVAALVVRNAGSEPVQYATLNLTDTSENGYTFIFSTIPAGCSVLVLETNKTVCPENINITEVSADVTRCESLDTLTENFSLRFDGNKLKLKNLTDTDYRAVYVRYKNYTAGNVYLGGITYNATFDNVAAQSEYEFEPAHFYAGGSQILLIQTVE